jgi:N utilization substance protein A
MSRELLQVIDQISYERGLDRETVLRALETALVSASRKRIGPEGDIRCRLSEDKSELLIYCLKQIVEHPRDPLVEISLEDARKIDPDAELDGRVEALTNLIEFGRIAAQTAKQVIMQRVREAERDLIHDDYKDREGQIIAGTVHHKEKGDLYVDLGKTDGLLPRKDQIPRESYRNGDRIRAYIKEVCKTIRGPQIILSRTAPEFLIRLFELEVPEIRDGIIKVLGAAREPGERAKIAVFSTSKEVDPVGACVGVKGSRVQSVVRELRGEKVDIVEWSHDIETYLRNALSPAEVESIQIDEKAHGIVAVVPEDQLSLAIGKKGQNVRLASSLLKWGIAVKSNALDSEEARLAGQDIRKQEVVAALGVNSPQADALLEAGLAEPKVLAEASLETLTALKGIGEKTALHIIKAAQQTLAATRGETDDKQGKEE